jgi:glycosyltransferase involved in cell wall biosynthesis
MFGQVDDRRFDSDNDRNAGDGLGYDPVRRFDSPAGDDLISEAYLLHFPSRDFGSPTILTLPSATRQPIRRISRLKGTIMDRSRQTLFKRIGFIGNYVPRMCGIATFTTDLCEAVAAAAPDTTCFAVPVNDPGARYAYPPRVRFELEQNDLATYRRTADFLNINNVDLVCLQHEYGIFGGKAGSHVLTLLGELRMPIVTTLHTVLAEPNEDQRRVLRRLAQLSDRLIVMSRLGGEILQEVYGVAWEKIDMIHHGIPDVPFVDPNYHKDRFGVEGKQVLLTFGLLSPNKGIEYVIEAMPSILARHPETVYIVLGATHPHVKRDEGESYRLQLERLARIRGVDKNILFFDRFVTLEELVEFIGAADIYVTPYLNPAQVTSGTLAYTVGAGKAVVSTPYRHAEELLADGRGLLVPFGDSAAIAERVNYLLENEAERHAVRKRAYQFGREMTWPVVAQRYLESFIRAQETRTRVPRAAFTGLTVASRPPEMPPLNLCHMLRLTDGTGMIQHACHTVPRYGEGYATDDNARALIVAVGLEELGERLANGMRDWAARYLAFLVHAFEPISGRFRNFLSYDRRWLEDVGSEDSHGRSLWALGTVIGRSLQPGLCGAAGHVFEPALAPLPDLRSPRAWAFALLGIEEYLKRYVGDRRVQSLREMLAERLFALHRATAAPDWPWFEERLTYNNATLPHALLIAGQSLRRDDMQQAALDALHWLMAQQRVERGHFVPVGSNGFWVRSGERARFDQQPVEAQAAVSASLTAQEITGDERWGARAQTAFDWFIGRNDLRLSLYDAATGGCRDGLHPDRCNQNQGAESTLSFLLALLEIRHAEAAEASANETERSRGIDALPTLG